MTRQRMSNPLRAPASAVDPAIERVQLGPGRGPEAGLRSLSVDPADLLRLELARIERLTRAERRRELGVRAASVGAQAQRSD